MIKFLMAMLIFDMIKTNSTQYVWLVIVLMIIQIILCKIREILDEKLKKLSKMH